MLSKPVERQQEMLVSQKKALYKRTLVVVSLSQMFGGAGLAAGITVGALLAQQMLGTDAYAGIPTALFTLGSAGGAFLVGRLSQRVGRRLGLTTGFMLGGLGAIGVIAAALFSNIVLLFASLLLYGAGTATNLQARYAGTDLAETSQRATAASTAMVFTTFGAIAGPNLVNVMGRVANSLGIPALAGPFLLSAAAYLLAGVLLFIMLRPDPLLLSRKWELQEQKALGYTARLPQTENKRGVMIGATVMVLTQVVMVAIMTMTPVHMRHHGHGLGDVGLVIGFHVGAMYLPSLITGMLVDKWGRFVMAIASGFTLLLAGITAAVAPPESMVFMVLALVLLGLGWNFGLISGTALLIDATTGATRAKTQGNVDVFVALSGAAGGVLSGFVVAGFSYATLAYVGASISVLLLFLFIRYGKSR
ncbi:putative permease [Fictibacillus macauensis ZFHKF-1]|uniref:Putative permease n=1 Tax=Fictibacillus macauensis ZFHKF-1 TaxID=1196324 RepID=I8UEL3_9BACL|nr:MFS transporter [Fictibacillus macauensis]EIT85258.1 putative permease [Fictibacillus macauensis ZFHKF-1]